MYDPRTKTLDKTARQKRHRDVVINWPVSLSMSYKNSSSYYVLVHVQPKNVYIIPDLKQDTSTLLLHKYSMQFLYKPIEA